MLVIGGALLTCFWLSVWAAAAWTGRDLLQAG